MVVVDFEHFVCDEARVEVVGDRVGVEGGGDQSCGGDLLFLYEGDHVLCYGADQCYCGLDHDRVRACF